MDLLLLDGLKPFSVLTGFIVVLLLVEIALMLVGLSSNVEVDGEGTGDGLDAASGVDSELDLLGDLPEIEILTADEIATLDLPPRKQQMPYQPPAVTTRLLRLFGIGRNPLLVSLTGFAAGIAACGYSLQLILQALTGAMLSGRVAMIISLVPGLLLGGRLAALVARLIPAFESHGISGQTYNGRRGHVVIGDARRGEPAQVRWRDLYGTTHSLMAEPLRDEDMIAAGTEVLIVKTRDRQPRIVSLSAS
jgi:hypothetical protein